jgi:nucleoside-diphosphate-sugar epimerase
LIAFVTGGTGFIGSHVVERLLAAGQEVRVLARESSDVSHLRRLGVEIARGDLRDGAALRRLLRGIEVVYHNAAFVGDWGRWRDFSEVALAGTEHLLAAAVRSDVSRVVHMSSAGVYGLRRIRGSVVSEELPLAPRPWRWDYYGRAKAGAERIVQRQQNAGRIGATILRPTIVYGPRDRIVLPRLAALLWSGQLVIVGSGENRLHLVYVRDAAEAAFRAGTEPVAVGGTYHIDGRREITQRRFMEAIADLVGAPRPRRSLPLSVSYCLGFLQEAWGHASGRQTPPSRTRYLVALAGGEACFDTSGAERDLGWKPQVCFEEGLARTADWWRSRGRPEISGSAPEQRGEAG